MLTIEDVLKQRQKVLTVYVTGENKHMERVALHIAGSTINQRLEQSAKIVDRMAKRGFVDAVRYIPLPSAKVFVKERLKQPMPYWGVEPKANFARALLGYNSSESAVCIDTWLARNHIKPVDADDQWTKWFKLRELVKGDIQDALVVHMRWLNYVLGA